MSGLSVPVSGLYAAPRPQWLARTVEEILEPDLPIVDAHHHLWDRADAHYMFDDYRADLASGHRIVSTVYVDCRTMYRADGPESLRPLGEVEFANGVAAMSASGQYGPTRVCDAIVGHADLRAGAAVRELLEAEQAAAGGRFKGIRQIAAWSADPDVVRPMASRPRGLLIDPAFRAGFAQLAPLGLSFDAFIFYPQLDELYDLAHTFATTQIVVDHVGGPLAIGRYAARRAEAFAEWAGGMRRLAELPNVWVKLGGLGMLSPGFDFHLREEPPGSEALAQAWRPYIETCIEAFGTARSMFESNFPPDKGSCSYAVLWNAFKRIAHGCSATEKEDLFRRAARTFYRLADAPLSQEGSA